MDFDEEAEPTLAIKPIAGFRVWGLIVRQSIPSLTPIASPRRDTYAPYLWAGRDDNPWLRPGWAKAECPLGLRPGTWHLVNGGVQKFSYRGRVEIMGVAIPCWCGIWAAKSINNFTIRFVMGTDKKKILGIPMRPRYVVGRVELAGAVLEHTDGYRAERARVTGLYDLGRYSGQIAMLAKWHDVPVLGTDDYLKEGMQDG